MSRKILAAASRALLGSVLLLSALPGSGRGVPELELYGTFHAMGVIAHLDVDDDPDLDATALLEYRPSGGGTYREAFPLSRAVETRFVGSLFWLEPGTTYDVRVSFEDPGGLLDGVILESSGSTRVEIDLPPPSRTLFVSPDGQGTACTAGAPCALAYALEQAEPGDEVVLREGVYYEGGFELPRSGTEEAPIVIRSAEGETAILDGADPASFSWIPEGEGIYRTTLNVPDTHLVLADGQRLFPYGSLADLQGLVWDAPGFFNDGSQLYVHLAGEADPAGVEIVISRHNFTFYLMQDHIAFLDLTFRHYGQGEWSKCIYLFAASNNLVRGCTFQSNDLGVGLKYESDRNLIEENIFSDTIFDWSWDGVKQEDHLEDGGVAFYEPCTGRGNVIRRNFFHDDFDGFQVCPAVLSGVTNETDVYENTVYRMGDDGMETDGQCSNVRIWDNVFHDVLMGVSVAPAYDGPVYVMRNLIYRTGVGNNIYSGSPFKFNSGYSPSGEIFLFHNTCDAYYPGNNGLYIKAPGSWDRITSRNNIWGGTAYALENYNTGEPLDLDFDDLWNDEAAVLVRWESDDYATLEEFTAATGQEPNGLSTAPGFTDPAAGDYTLDSGSDLIDAGVVIPGINDDFAGQAPDLGAFEYDPDSSGFEETGAEPAWLLTCSPNPFGEGTAIRYRLDRPRRVDLAVFDLGGRRVATLFAGDEAAGDQRHVWNGQNDHGLPVRSGVYYVRLRAAGLTRATAVVRVD